MPDRYPGWAPRVRTTLKEWFGLDHFRPLQEEIVCRALAGESQVAVLPTGSGKSLCYQLPSLLLPHPTVVISPLIALMKDQVDSLAVRGIRANALTGRLSVAEQRQMMQDWEWGRVPLLFLAPERLQHPELLGALDRGIKTSLLVVDEAHCISEWGHDFRPDYRRIREFRNRAGNPPVMALTATASPRVRRDIVYQLALPDEDLIQHELSVDRPNLHFGVQVAASTREQRFLVSQRIADTKRPVIVYAGTRRQAEEWGEWLAQDLGGAVAVYHAGLPEATRTRVQDDFVSGRVQCVVATTAFGMGINRHDVGDVIHVSVPESMAAYYQEVGRAGRDGALANAQMYIRYGDLEQRETRIELGEPQFTAVQRILEAIQHLPPKRRVRWELLDDDLEVSLVMAALHDMQMIAVGDRSGRTVGVTRLGDLDDLTAESIWNRLEQRHRYRQEQFRLMKSYVLGTECRRRGIGQYFGQSLSSRETDCCDVCDRGGQDQEASPDWSLVKVLRQWRAKMAQEADLPPYRILDDRTIQSLATAVPKTLEALRLCPGIGPVKLTRYGEALLAIIRPFTNSQTVSSDPTELLLTPKTLAIAMFREGVPLDEVTRRVARSHSTVIGYLVEWISTMDVEDWRRYVLRLVPPSLLATIVREFEKHGADRLRPVFEALGGTCSYDILRVVQAIIRRQSLSHAFLMGSPTP